jgi:hypothetical protein
VGAHDMPSAARRRDIRAAPARGVPAVPCRRTMSADDVSPSHLARCRAALSRVGFDMAAPGRKLDSRDRADSAAVVEVKGHPAARTGAVVVVEVALFAVALDVADVARLVSLCELGDGPAALRAIVEHPHAVRHKAPPASGPRVRPRRRASDP